MDAIAWGCVLAALASTVVAVLAMRRGRTAAALVLVILAALFLRTNLAWHHWLSDWDERYHAVVARNMIDDPLRPTLIADPFDAQPIENWPQAHGWLHKPPLATWLMAGSMATFGENEVAARVPSVLLAGLAVGLTFWLGWRFFGPWGGLLAALLHAWHGRLALLAGGLRATDHVDHQIMVLVELAACLGILAADALADPERKRRGLALALACGLAAGAAWLTKSILALVGIGVLGLALLARRVSWPLRIAAVAIAVVATAAVALPWHLHSREVFPELAAFYAARNARYFTEVVDGHGGPVWFYLRDLAKMFGYVTPLAVAIFLLDAIRRRELLPLWGWLLAVYLGFSFAATKMTAYVFVAAPVVFCFLAGATVQAFRAPRSGWSLAYRTVAVLALVSFAGASAWRVHRPWRAPVRTELWAEELRALGDAVASLEPARWVVFNVPSQTEALFYMRATPVTRRPTDADLARAKELGFRVAVYGEPAPPTDGAEITWIPRDPRTLDAYAILQALPGRDAPGEVQIFNAREAASLEAYLERVRAADVAAETPERLEPEPGALNVLLLPEAAAAPAPLPPGWHVVRSEAYSLGEVEFK